MFPWHWSCDTVGPEVVSDDHPPNVLHDVVRHTMFFSAGLEQLDPALLAFVKCHVTSPVKWEVLRVLASQEGAWMRADQLARRSHRRSCELTQAVAELAADGVVEILAAGAPEDGPRISLGAIAERQRGVADKTAALGALDW